MCQFLNPETPWKRKGSSHRPQHIVRPGGIHSNPLSLTSQSEASLHKALLLWMRPWLEYFQHQGLPWDSPPPVPAQMLLVHLSCPVLLLFQQLHLELRFQCQHFLLAGQLSPSPLISGLPVPFLMGMEQLNSYVLLPRTCQGHPVRIWMSLKISKSLGYFL